MKRLLLPLATLLFLAGCNYTVKSPPNFYVVLQSWNEGISTLNMQYNRTTRLPNGLYGDTTVRLAFTRAELDTVYTKLLQADLEDLAEKNGPACLFRGETKEEYALVTSALGKQYLLNYRDNCSTYWDHSGDDLLEAIHYIQQVARRKPEVAALPPLVKREAVKVWPVAEGALL